MIFAADADDGSITALVSEGIRSFKPSITTDNADITGCRGDTEPIPTACETSVYINFDLDSATIRPESDGVLADLFATLDAENATSIQIVGHTSTEGDADYNPNRSRRRAQAVVDDLVDRGLDPASISADGRGEAEPLASPDDTESAREINRRVEILCG